ncbi:trypsin-like peptidase domain-containing protein [Nonomuraea sp. NPDC059007]|uniref:trypsin-like peptidase domain-containing protein n=1 Tax=Nonomuraea sp. NPDC059007 TaxID=3346692 RepID=UPI0036BCFC27
MDAMSQTRAAAARYASKRDDRARIQRRREQTGQHIVDDADQVTARAERLVQHGTVSVATVERLSEQSPDRLLERIVGVSADFQPANFLARGARAITSVGRITQGSNGRAIPVGTGFLVAPSLLLTNNHVLPDQDSAGEAEVEFGAEMSIDNDPPAWTRFRLDPSAAFVTDEELDYTLVRVVPAADGRTAGDLYGWNRLMARQGKIVTGEPVNLVGHPNGRLKEITIRRNELTMQLDHFLHYSADTEPGSSGSPVFNDQWEVVALHHSGVPGEDGAWIANEGVRVSSILSGLPAGLLSELGAAPLAAESIAPVRQAGAPARPSAFGGTRHLVFLHGRGQTGRDPQTMRREWIAGLNKGLTLAGLPTVEPADVWFPFYGDTLTEPRESLIPASPTTRVVYEQLIGEAAALAGRPADGRREGLLTGVQGALSWLASATNLDHLLIAAVFRDVAAYLDDSSVRQAVLASVERTLPASGQVVLVAHSLGTVVAMDLLTRLPAALEVPLLVTLGSPLGLDAVQGRLLSGGPHRPDRAGQWLNVWSQSDPVSIGCPLEDDWKGQVDERAVDNPLQRSHDVAEYLSHPHVARSLLRHLT